MTTYDASAVADAVIAHKKGITLQQGRALRDNPLAMFEGAADAPRLAMKVNTSSVGPSSTISKTGISSFGGVMIWGQLYNASGSTSRSLSMALGDSGGMAASTNVLTLGVNGYGTFSLFVDFSDLEFQVTYADFAAPSTGGSTTALTDPGGAITQLELYTGADMRLSASFYFNGGYSTT